VVDVIAPQSLLSPGDAAALRELAQRAATLLDVSGEVRVRVVDDAHMADAHERWGGVPGTTDVLTFDLRDGRAARDGEMDTDVLVCVDEARRQSVSRGVAVVHELLLYVLHAMLHCMGYDDHDEGDYRAMHEREDAVLREIGVGDVFAREAPDAGGTP
jgi:probable rRNA maturation factor